MQGGFYPFGVGVDSGRMLCSRGREHSLAVVVAV